MRPGRNYPLPPKDVPKGKPNIVFILTDEYVGEKKDVQALHYSATVTMLSLTLPSTDL